MFALGWCAARGLGSCYLMFIFSFQATQILLSLVIVGLGIILAFNFIFFSKKFPLVILTGYPFWGAFIFFLAGFITVFNDKLSQNVRQGVTIVNILSSLVALAGIALILISFTQQHKFCQAPSLEGTCAVGRTLLLVSDLILKEESVEP